MFRIEWPGKDSSPSPPKGYVYIVFDDEEHVPHLLSQCSHNNTACYFKISSRRMRSKEVQIIPWVLADSNYVRCPSQRQAQYDRLGFCFYVTFVDLQILY